MDRLSLKILYALKRKEKLSKEQIRRIVGAHEKGLQVDRVRFLTKGKLIVEIVDKEDSDGYAALGDDATHFELTVEGYSFLYDRRRDQLGFILPYSITTAIAVVSLIRTFVSN